MLMYWLKAEENENDWKYCLELKHSENMKNENDSTGVCLKPFWIGFLFKYDYMGLYYLHQTPGSVDIVGGYTFYSNLSGIYLVR